MRMTGSWLAGAVAFGMLGSAVAAAQAPGETASTPLPPAPPPPNPDARKSPLTAGLLSGLVTAGGYVLIGIGASSNSGDGNGGLIAVGVLATTVGPTTGHIYAGHTWNTGLAIRLVSAGVLVADIAACANGCDGGDAATVAVFSALGFTVGAVYEIISAPEAARQYNHEHGLDVQLSVVPIRDARNTQTPAVGLALRF